MKNCKDRLEKEELKMVHKMNQEKNDFEIKVQDIKKKQLAFVTLSDMNNFEENSTNAKLVQAEILAAVENAKVFNNREALTGNLETSYDHIG